jgi:hypothetical protein
VASAGVGAGAAGCEPSYVPTTAQPELAKIKLASDPTANFVVKEILFSRFNGCTPKVNRILIYLCVVGVLDGSMWCAEEWQPFRWLCLRVAHD